MNSIRTQAHDVLAFKLNHARLGISLSLSKAWEAQNNVTKGRDQALWYINNNEWLQLAPKHTVYSHSSWLMLDYESLYLSLKHGKHKNNVTKGRDQALWYINNNGWLQFAPTHTVYSHSIWLMLDLEFLYLSLKQGKDKNNGTKGRDQALWYISNNEWLNFAPKHMEYSHSSWLMLN